MYTGRSGNPIPVAEYVSNGGFEVDTTGWSAANGHAIAQSVAQAHTGTGSLLVTVANSNLTMVFENVTLTKAISHRYSCWLYIPAAYDGTQLQIQVGNFTAATGTIAVDAQMSKRDQWQYVTAAFVPAGADFAGNVRFAGTGVAPTAGRTFYIDDVSLIESG